MVSFGNESNEPIFLSTVMSCLNKKLLFPTILSKISFDLAHQAETDILAVGSTRRGQKFSEKTLIQEVLGHSWGALAALQGREKGKAEWRRSLKRRFAKLRRVKGMPPVNTASRSKTLQDFADLAGKWQTR